MRPVGGNRLDSADQPPPQGVAHRRAAGMRASRLWVYYRVVPQALQQLSQLLGANGFDRRTLSGAPMGRRLLAEFVGTALLVTVVVGSGIAAAQLSPNDVGLQLLENSIATAFGLAVLILLFGPVSGAHFNPVVTAADWLWAVAPAPASAQTTRPRTPSRRWPAASPGRCWPTHVRPACLSDRDQGPDEHRTPGRGSGGNRRADRPDLRAGPQRPGRVVGRRGRRVHRRGLLVHQLHGIRQPRRHRGPDVLRHLRRHRSRLGAGFIAAQIVGALLGLALIAALYPDAPARRPRRRPASLANARQHRATESVMTESPAPLAAHHRKDLSIDQRHALKTAATRLRREYADIFGTETIERFLHSSYDQFAGRATIPSHHCLPSALPVNACTRWPASRQDHRWQAHRAVPVPHNAGRSPVALGLFTHLAGDRAVAWSGRSEAGTEINPSAVEAMAEVGIDITGEVQSPGPTRSFKPQT